ncbi:hypothetical protein HKD37_20G056426 [Glycine soja]
MNVKVKVLVFIVAVLGSSSAAYEMNEDQWINDSIMSKEVDTDYQNEEEYGMNEPHVDCSDAFNTSQVFDSRDDVLQWARSIAHENRFVAVIIRSDTNTGSRGRTLFVLIGCERSGEYRCRKKEFVRRDTGTRKCGCPFKLHGKPVVGGQSWMVKLMCGIHNHELAKSLVGHPYVGRLTKAEKTLIADMTKSMVKPRNILLTLKEHNVNSCTTIKQIYNARSAYRSSIRGSDTEILKDEDVVRDIFWCHPDAVKLVNACNLVTTHGLPCACELSKYVVGCIPLDSIHMFWKRLSFLDQGLSEPEVTIKEEMETISKRFEELDLWEIAYPDQNSMCPPPTKEYVDVFHSMQNNNSSVRRSTSSSEKPNPRRIMPMLDQFQPFIHDFIDNIVDVKLDGNCGYRLVADLSSMGEDSWLLVRNHLLKELGKFSHEMSLLVNGLTKVTMDKWMDITDMGYVIASRYNVTFVSLSQQQSMTFFPLRTQPPPDSSMHRIICIDHVYNNHFVQHCYGLAIVILRRSSGQLQILVECSIIEASRCSKETLTDKQYLDENYYRQSFTDTGNQFRFQCMQLKNDDDVNTMLMCNHQFSCVGLIELLCIIARTPDGILNLLEATMTSTHDVLLYYNGRWNMSRQNEFVGYSFTGKNPIKCDFPSKCNMDELKDLIKQVAPHGIPPYGIHETQTVMRLFFRQPSHYEYSDKIIKFEIMELKTNDDMLKVLVQSNYWKTFGPIEILVVFSKHVMEMEDDVSLSQN